MFSGGKAMPDVFPRPSSQSELPSYHVELSGFHRAFECELRGLLEGLPLSPSMKVLDFACGNGKNTRRIADQLGLGGSVTGVDVNLAYLSQAREEARGHTGRATVDFVEASFDELPFADETFDFVWCAQSLFSLPSSTPVLRHVRRVLRPGGVLAILESDTMHQVVLPWPIELELSLRQAELRAQWDDTPDPSKYYIGRRLPAVLAAAQLAPVSMATVAIDRQAPFAEPERELLQSYFDGVERRVAPYLDASVLYELHELTHQESPRHMLLQPHLTMTWLNVLALGRKRLGGHSEWLGSYARSAGMCRHPDRDSSVPAQ
jgi:SAM-dependent methyltransferase